MDTPTPQWPQGIGVVIGKSEAGGCVQKNTIRAQKAQQPLNCPRCSSSNTKFCYYNNYSLSQPRYFCKTCRRYWTEGGTLRNVPVGGASRKYKRPNSNSPQSSSKNVDLSSPPSIGSQNPKIIHQGHDLNLGFNPSPFDGISEFGATIFGIQNPNFPSQNHHLSVTELSKRGDYVGSGSVASSFVMPGVPVSDANLLCVNSSGFNDPVSDQLKSSLGFSVGQNGYIMQKMVDQDQRNSSSSSSRSAPILFPFEELKPISSNEFGQERGQGETNGYWINNGTLAGGSW